MHLSLIALSLAFGLAGSRNLQHTRERRTSVKDLNVVMNNTVCPIRVHTSNDPNRVPRLIKELKCGPDPLGHCRQMDVPEAECCHVNRDGQQLACVEVEDIVEVFFPATQTWQPLRVSVGCSCLIDLIPEAGEFTPFNGAAD